MIYIVEDDRNIQEIELFALKNSGYTAAGFETAKEFFKAMESKLPELILLDIMLSDEDGLSILRKLRARADTQKIPVILVTAKSAEIDKVKGLDGGADDYITKPFGVMEMISRVKALLRRSGGTGDGLLTCGSVTLDKEKRMVYVDGEPVELIPDARYDAVQSEGFINIIDGTTDGLEPTLDEGLRAQAALDAAYRAVKEHRWVKISEITGKE